MNLLTEVVDYYERHPEAGRLRKGIGPLEWSRTRELVARYLPARRRRGP